MGEPWLNAAAFPDGAHGWAVGGFGYADVRGTGVIFATSDGGATWAQQQSWPTASLQDVAFVDASHGWASSASGLILSTSDGGVTWDAQSFGSDCWLGSLTFADATHGWVVGGRSVFVKHSSDRIFATSDGGATWAMETLEGVSANDIAFVDDRHGWLVGFGGGSASGGYAATVLSTCDGGVSWSPQDPGMGLVPGLTSPGLLVSVAFTDVTHGWAVGEGILATFTGGAPDRVPPVTTASGASDGAWYNADLSVSLAAQDNEGGSGVDFTEHQLDGAEWTWGNAVPVAGDGLHTLSFRSVDLYGNVEQANTLSFGIDTSPPLTLAPSPAKTDQSGVATLSYEVLDALPNGGSATVTIAIESMSGHAARTLSLGSQPVNTPLSGEFTADVPNGAYRFYVYATDTAGNTQANLASSKLVVR